MFRKNLYFIIIALISACSKTDIQVVEGISHELAQFRKKNISEIEYDLYFSIPDSLDKKIFGEAIINFDLASKKADIQIDFKGDTSVIFETVINNKKLSLKIINQHIVIPKSHLRKGANTFVISFECPDISLNRNPEFLYTLFVPDRASTTFPCFDQPDLKAEFKLKLDIPSEWKAVSNSSEISIKAVGNKNLIEFGITKLIPTYLFAFTAGKFDTITRENNGKKYTLFHREKEEKTFRNNIDSIFSLLNLSLNKIEDYTRISQPFEKYDLVSIPSLQYNGMEHPGAIYYRSSSLFLDESPTRQQLLNRANLIAHETAHIWFGNLVTMPWFDEVWLKEVFANFIADKIVSTVFHEVNFDVLFHLSHFEAAYSVDRTMGANAIGQKLNNMKDAGSLYGSIIYHKSPIIMRMLEKRTGEEKLQKALQKYLQKYAFGNAGWNDLISLIDVPEKKALQKWSDSWVYLPGRPYIKAYKNENNLIIEQSDSMNKGRSWPLDITIASSINKNIEYLHVSMENQKTEITDFFKNGVKDWIYLNPKGNLYALIEIDSISGKSLMNNFSDFNDDLFRASVLADFFENLNSGNIKPQQFIDFILKILPKENNTFVYERMLNYLENCFLYKTDIAEKFNISEEIEKKLWSEFENRENKKTAIINCLIKIASTKKSLIKLENLLRFNDIESNFFLSLEQQIELALNLSLFIPEKANEILSFQEKRISDSDKLERFRFIKNSVDPDRNKRNEFFAQLLDAENRERETWVDVSMAYLNHPNRQNESLQYIKPALLELKEIQQTGDIFFPKTWLYNLFKGHNSDDAATIVKQFLADNPEYPENLKMKILQSADHLLRRKLN